MKICFYEAQGLVCLCDVVCLVLSVKFQIFMNSKCMFESFISIYLFLMKMLEFVWNYLWAVAR